MKSAFLYQFNNSRVRQLGYLSWFLLAVLALVFYKERATFMDGGFQLTELINSESFGIYHHRLTNPLTQILPLLAIKLALPLKAVMIAYSLNFIVFFALIYHLIAHYCKNDFLAWTQIFFFILFTGDTFYFLTPEFYQGMSLLLLWFALFLRFDFYREKWLFAVLMLLLIPIIFDHLLLAVFFLFLWIFFFLDRPDKVNIEYYLLLIAVFLIFWLRGEFFTSWYDAMKQKDFWFNFEKYSPNFHLIPAWKIFLKKCLSLYYFFPALLTLGFGFYIFKIKKNWKNRDIRWRTFAKAILLIGFCFSYLLIIHVGDPLSPYVFYAEVNYMGLAVPISVVLFFDFFQNNRTLLQGKIVFFTLIIIVSIRLLTIASKGEKFTKRQEWITDQFEDTNASKLIIKGKEKEADVYIQDWSLPEESLLLTSLHGAKESKTFLLPTDEKQYKPYLDQGKLWLEKGRQVPLSEMNRNYFQLDNKKYKIIENQ